MNKTEENRFCNFTLINLSTPPPQLKLARILKKTRNQKKKQPQNNTIPPPYARIFLVAEIHIFSIYDDKAGLILLN